MSLSKNTKTELVCGCDGQTEEVFKGVSRADSDQKVVTCVYRCEGPTVKVVSFSQLSAKECWLNLLSQLSDETLNFSRWNSIGLCQRNFRAIK